MSETIACIAGGPSLTPADAAKASKYFTIGVNDAYRIARVDILYASDHPWWRMHIDRVGPLQCLKLCGSQDPMPPAGVETIPAKRGADLTDSILNFGTNSGFAALHLALLLGADRVLLLGYDMKYGSKRHWFGDHPAPLNNANSVNGWASEMARSPKPSTPIINCSRDTALRCFPRASIDEFL